MGSNVEKHLKHPFYQDVNEYREMVRVGQILKGAEKYPEPFTTSSWSNDEIIEHAMQENVDQAHYIYAAKERMEVQRIQIVKLVKENERLRKEIDRLKNPPIWTTEDSI